MDPSALESDNLPRSRKRRNSPRHRHVPKSKLYRKIIKAVSLFPTPENRKKPLLSQIQFCFSQKRCFLTSAPRPGVKREKLGQPQTLSREKIEWGNSLPEHFCYCNKIFWLHEGSHAQRLRGVYSARLACMQLTMFLCIMQPLEKIFPNGGMYINWPSFYFILFFPSAMEK